jgi:hypothetical protein
MLGDAHRRNVPETSDSLFEMMLSSASLTFSAVPSVFRGCELIVPAVSHHISGDHHIPSEPRASPRIRRRPFREALLASTTWRRPRGSHFISGEEPKAWSSLLEAPDPISLRIGVR